MALTADAMCTLANVKAMLDISDTTQDARLEMLINSTSAMIASYCGRVFTRTTYTAESYTGTNRQLLVLRQWPLVSVSSITTGGTTIASTEYEVKTQDQAMGAIYKANGWNQSTTYATGLTLDTWASGRDYEVTYVAGYYMPTDVTVAPADPHYVAGAAGSLPLDLTDCCMQIVMERNEKIKNGAVGLTQLTEGGLTYSWGAATTSVDQDSGISAYVIGALKKYRRRFVA